MGNIVFVPIEAAAPKEGESASRAPAIPTGINAAAAPPAGGLTLPPGNAEFMIITVFV